MKSVRFRVFNFAASLLFVGAINLNTSVCKAGTDLQASIQKDRADINYDLGAINNDKARIETYREKYKTDCKLKDKEAMIRDKEQLCKAQASLNKNQAYLTADKRTLIRNHKLAIAQAENAVKENKSDLARNRSMLKSAKYNGYTTVVSNYAVNVEKCEKDLKNSEDVLRSRRLQRDADVLAMNKNIRKANGEFAGTLYVQNSLATADKWINK